MLETMKFNLSLKILNLFEIEVIQFLWIFLLTICIIWFLQYHWKRRFLYLYSRNIHGPRGYPIIGNILDFVGNSDDIYNNVIKHFQKYPNLAKIWYGSTLIYGISKPEYLEKVLTSPKALKKMYLYKYAEPLVGYGLFTAPVSTWKRHRKIIMPAFNQKILDSFVEIFSRQTNKLSKILQNQIDKTDLDLFHFISRCTLDIICETAMGITVQAQNSDSLFGQWVDRLLEIMFLRMFVIYYHFDFLFKFTTVAKDQDKLIKKFHYFTRNIINNKIQQFKKNPMEIISKKRKAFLDLIIEGNQLSTEEITDEVNTFIIAGSDTTATTILFTFLMLGMHKKIQQQVYEEISEILSDRVNIQPTDLPKMKFLERVIKETMRLFPIGPFIVRDIEADLVLENNVILAKGSSAILGIMPLHRSPEYWHNPLQFNPDRFLPEEISKRHPFSYLPFSGGSRNCVGPKYAMMALKAMIAVLIQKFEFFTNYKSVEEIKLKTNLIIRPVDGFQIYIKTRK